MDADERACPFCAETIKAAAIVCKHCGRDVPDVSRLTPEAVALGIVWSAKDERFMWRDGYFKKLDDALVVARLDSGAGGAGPARVAHAPVASPEVPQRGSRWWLWFVPLALVLFLVWASKMGDTPEARERSRQRLAIETCWKEQGRKSLEPSSQRFIAGACERMESNFKATWGMAP